MNRVIQTVVRVGLHPPVEQYQIVRWIRKPRKPFWLGIAKTKKFRIPEPPPQSVEEYETLKAAYRVYRTQLKSVTQHLQKEYQNQQSITPLQAQSEELTAAIEESFLLNEQFNKTSSRLREQRLEEEAKKYEDYIIQTMNEKDLKEERRNRLAESFVQTEDAKKVSFITANNIDEAIDKSLSEVLSYEFAIDLSGKIYDGKEEEEQMKKESTN